MGKLVLVVDDNDKNRKLLKIILEKKGYEVKEAVDGRDAVEIARKEPPDLVLTDIRMPVMDGIEATRIMKSEEPTKSVPVIIITSSAMKGDRERLMAESGCDAYIAKPLDIREVLEVVERFIGAA
ncbi:MAG: response regulator [Thermodesulfovibrionales bacterium]|jgi:CheY-like chemotaxis protein